MRRGGLFQGHQGGGDFAGGVVVAGFLGGRDARAIKRPGKFKIAGLLGSTAGHEVSGNVVGLAAEEFAEFGQGILMAALAGVFHGDGIAEKRVVGFGGQEGEELIERRHEKRIREGMGRQKGQGGSQKGADPCNMVSWLSRGSLALHAGAASIIVLIPRVWR